MSIFKGIIPDMDADGDFDVIDMAIFNDIMRDEDDDHDFDDDDYDDDDYDELDEDEEDDGIGLDDFDDFDSLDDLDDFDL